MAKIKQFSNPELEEILSQSTVFWNQSSTMMSDFFKMVNDTEKMYRVQLPEDLETQMKKHLDRAALAPPDFYINVKSIRAALRRLLFSSKPFAVLSVFGRPNVRSDGLMKAQWKLQELLDVQNDGKGFESEADKVFLQALYAGTTACFTEWYKKKVRRVVRDPQSGQPLVDPKTGITIFYKEVIAEYPQTRAIDIRRIRIDPAADGIDTIKIVGYHYLANISDLIAETRDPDSPYDFSESDLNETSFERDKYFEYARGESDKYPEKTMQNQGFGDKIVEVWEIRGMYRFKNKTGDITYKDLVIRIANKNLIISAEHNPLPIPGWELFDFPSVDQEVGRMFSMGICQPFMDTWLEKFVKRNQALDEASRQTYPRYIGDKAACEDLPDIIEDIPNLIIKVDTMAAGAQSVDAVLRPIPRPSQGHDTFFQSESLTAIMKSGQGLSDYTLGNDPERTETATAVTAVVSGGQNLLGEIAIKLKDSFLSPTWRKHLILWNFFKGHEANQVQTPQGEVFNINPDELSLYYKVDMDIQTQLDQPTMVRRFVESFAILREDPTVDNYEVTHALIQTLKLPNPDRIQPPSEHLRMIVERENAALMYGIELPVSPQDNDSLHIELHLKALEMVQSQPPEVSSAQKLTDTALIKHIDEHIESQSKKNGALGNTKELGGNSGSLANPEAAAIKRRTGATGGSRGLAREGRA